MKLVLTHTAALAVGTGVGYLVAKKVLEEKYAQLAQEEIESVKEYFGKSSAERLAAAVEEAEKERATTNPNGALSRNSLDQGKTAYGRSKTAYHEMTKENIRKRWDSERGGAVETSDDEDESDEPVKDAAGCYEGDMENSESQKDLSDVDRTAPYVISVEEFTDEFHHHDKISLYYYTEDEVLCDEHEEVVLDIDGTVGREVFDTFEEGENIAWARNERIGIDYEICAVAGSFAEIVHGGRSMSPRERYQRKQKWSDEDE